MAYGASAIAGQRGVTLSKFSEQCACLGRGLHRQAARRACSASAASWRLLRTAFTIVLCIAMADKDSS